MAPGICESSVQNLLYITLLGFEFWDGFEIFEKFVAPDLNNIHLAENTLGLEYKLQLGFLFTNNDGCLF
jgi:hypothetical protein